MTTTIVLILSLFQPAQTSSKVPDLCTEAVVDASGAPVSDSTGLTLSRYCQWAGPDAPRWDGDVCCTIDQDGASCVEPDDRGACDWGTRSYCERAEVTTTGAVVCYQALPSTCDVVPCMSPTLDGLPEVPVDSLCCENGDCWEWDHTTQYSEDCLGYFSWCSSGYLNEDGTVDCYD